MLRQRLGRSRSFRVLLVGLTGVGKTALAVRFVTRRYIGEYDHTLESGKQQMPDVVEMKYRLQTEIDDDTVMFEVFDPAVQKEETITDDHIKWADAFVMVYDITDRCSFEECTRLKFLINMHAKKPRSSYHPVAFLVGNKCDKEFDRMVSMKEAQEKCENLACSRVYEISVRESPDDARNLFYDLYRTYREERDKRPKLIKQVSVHEDRRSINFSEDGLSLLPPEPSDRFVPKMSAAPGVHLEDTHRSPGLSLRRKPSVSERLMRAVRTKERSRNTEDMRRSPTF